MSELTATNCGCGCDNGCANSCGCGGNGNGCGLNNSCLWIILLLCCCGGWGGNGCGGCGNGCGNDSCLWIILLLCCCGGWGNNGFGCGGCGNGCNFGDADICSFFHFKWGMRKNRMPLLAYLFKRFGFPVTTLCSALFSSDVIFFSFSSPSFFFNIHFSSISYTAFPSIINFLDIFVFLSSSYY